MKRIFTLIAMVAIAFPLWSQLNMTLRDKIEYNVNLNDVWGWYDEVNDVEYGIVGLGNATSIVDLSDPDNIVEVARIPGPQSTWRDIKTWGNYAYVVHDNTQQPGAGLLVIDMSKLPDEAPFVEWKPNIPEIGGQLERCHNLYIDERGVCYLAGCNLNSGGILFVDVFSNPGQPEMIGWNEAVYSHDVFVRDGKMYDSQINRGRLAIYDVEDLSAPTLLATQTTPFNFTHNAWLSDDSKTVFTTDERNNAPVAAYDISDLDDIQLLDEFRPIPTIGNDVVPHNVHVWDDWLLISYYTDGGIVVDASRPNNLIEVGNFDTFLGNDGGTNGAWGLYPFLPSGTVLVTDIDNGFYVLTPNLVRAAWLEGTVTEAGTGVVLQGVDVSMDAMEANMGSSNVDGYYETGVATAGTFDVTFSKSGYETKTVSVTIANGEVTILDVELVSFPKFSVSGTVVEEGSGNPVPNAIVKVFNNEFDFETVADANGTFTLDNVFEGDYEVVGGAWGYRHAGSPISVSVSGNYVIELPRGYQDDFLFDFNWATSSDQFATTGFWELGEPEGTEVVPTIYSNPEFDLADDLGVQCYVTGNGGGAGLGANDIDNGVVILASPPMDLTWMSNPAISFHAWFYNQDFRNFAHNDTLMAFISNGTEEVVLTKIFEPTGAWVPLEFPISGLLDITDNMIVTFTAGDYGQGHVAEAGIDGFSVVEGVSSTNDFTLDAKLEVFPNPFEMSMTFQYQLEQPNANLQITNLLGQVVENQSLTNALGSLQIGANWTPGVYFAKIQQGEKESEVVKLIKQ